jgi:hypothetical protein
MIFGQSSRVVRSSKGSSSGGCASRAPDEKTPADATYASRVS